MKILKVIWVLFFIVLWAIFDSIASELERYIDELVEKWNI